MSYLLVGEYQYSVFCRISILLIGLQRFCKVSLAVYILTTAVKQMELSLEGGNNYIYAYNYKQMSISNGTLLLFLLKHLKEN
jgi:hypothetical protein